MQRNVMVVAVVLLALLLTGGAQAFEILVWDHDNNLQIADPVYRQNLTATDAIVRTLRDLDLDFDLVQNLPNDMSRYDVVMTALSFYCPG